jgi:hypothetical protein
MKLRLFTLISLFALCFSPWGSHADLSSPIHSVPSFLPQEEPAPTAGVAHLTAKGDGEVKLSSATSSPSSGSLVLPSQAVNGVWNIDNITGGQRISMHSAADGWMFRINGTVAELSRWNGSAWSPAGSVSHTQNIGDGDILMVSGTDGWLVLRGIVSTDPPATSIYRWNGASWQLWDVLDPGVPGTALQRLDMLSADDIWAVAPDMFGTKFYHWTGSAWNQSTYLCCDVNVGWDLDMLTPTDGWSVGYSGQIAHWNGIDWSIITDLGDQHLSGIDMLSANDGWIVGEGGVIYHWNGNSWNLVPGPVDTFLNEVDMVTASDGWAVGADGVIIHWDGNSWTQVNSRTGVNLNMVRMVSRDDGWIVGEGVTLRYVTPHLTMNYQVGMPGSYFNLNGSSYPPDSPIQIMVNNQILQSQTADLRTDLSGVFTVTLSTIGSGSGKYYLTASTNPSATIAFALDLLEPLRPREGTFPVFNIPAGIALDEFVYLPLLCR